MMMMANIAMGFNEEIMTSNDSLRGQQHPRTPASVTQILKTSSNPLTSSHSLTPSIDL